jgi:hypothetical protein
VIRCFLKKKNGDKSERITSIQISSKTIIQQQIEIPNRNQEYKNNDEACDTQRKRWRRCRGKQEKSDIRFQQPSTTNCIVATRNLADSV